MVLNKNQQLAVNDASKGHNILLLGSAGTGKSYVLCEIYDTLTSQGKKVKLTCSTGIACSVYPTRLNAETINKFAGIDDGRHEPSQIASVLRNVPKYDKVIQEIMVTDVLIIDECSMISERTFESVKSVCEMKDPKTLFGGIQIIFCGDFYQLPPVPNRRYNDDGSFCFQSKYFEHVFPHKVTLTENVRQNEKQFVEVLNEIHQGILSESGAIFMKSLTRALNLPAECDADTVKLFSTNLLVDTYNRKCLLNSPGNLFEFKAIDSGDTAELKKLTVPSTLWLKVGCPVILLRNLSDILVNGLRGTLTSVTDTVLTVKFPTLTNTTSIKKEAFTG
jgi:ATP-dependent DNA helicase PIF1